MITSDQLKDVLERTEKLHHYLNIDQKKVEFEEEQLRTQAPDFWDDPKRAEAQMKKVKGIEKWLNGYKQCKQNADELQLAFDYYKEELVTEEEVDADYAKAVKCIEDLELKNMLRFLLYYFNDCPLAEEVFPERGYKLHKNLLIQGGVGVGKTLLMQIFSEYLRRTNNPRFFHNVSVTQMVNYYTIHNNLDRFTYFEEESKGFQCKPENVCLNDIGIQDRTFFGMDTGLLTDEFRPTQPWIIHGFRGNATVARQLLRFQQVWLSFGEHFNADALAATP